MRLQLFTTVLAVLVGMAAAGADGNKPSPPKRIPNTYRVWLKEDAEKSASEHAEWASSIHETRTGGHSGVHHVIDIAPDSQGYLGMFTDHVINIIRKDKDVNNSAS